MVVMVHKVNMGTKLMITIQMATHQVIMKLFQSTGMFLHNMSSSQGTLMMMMMSGSETLSTIL